MSDSNPINSVPQFRTLQDSQLAPSGDICKVCRQPITGLYYRANSAMVCGSCADRVKRELPQDSHAAFVRGLFFGLGGFLAASIAYSAVGILLQGWTIGYLSLAVGWVVGKAMMAGSRGVGGRRYQMIAVLLTYAAVSMAAIPIALATMKSDSTSATRAESQTSSNSSSETQSAEQQQSPAPNSNQREHHMSFMAAIGGLALVGLASPFYELQDGFNGVLMLIILFVGMRFAWRITAGRASVAINGPFELSKSASA
jgi:hypothetical protein